VSLIEWFAVLAGLLTVGGTLVSVVKTLVVPRRAWSLVPRAVDVSTEWGFMVVARRMRSYDLIDRWLGFLGPVALILTLLVWLGLFVVGFALLLVPSTPTFSEALAQSGSSTFTLGITSATEGATTAIDVAASATGLIVIALTIAYLPALYQVVRRRETLSMQLETRIGSPAWGPSVLVEYCAAGALQVLPSVYADWDRWACEVDDGHTKYPLLNQFRLPRSRHHWLLSLIAVMDAAAIDLSVRRSPPAEARLFLWSGVACVNDLAGTLQLSEREIEDPLITKEGFERAMATVGDSGFPCEVPVDQSWLAFVAWRKTYAVTVSRILDAVVAPDAPWTGNRSLPIRKTKQLTDTVNSLGSGPSGVRRLPGAPETTS
jgi:hypothetical protein